MSTYTPKDHAQEDFYSKQFTRSLNLFYIQLKAIQNILSASKAKNYSESNAVNFVQCLDSGLNDIDKEVQSLINSELDAESRLNQIQTFQKELPIIVAAIQHIRNAQIKWLPWSMVGSIRDIANTIVPGTKILVTGTLHSSYRIVPPTYEPANDLPHEKFAIVQIPFLHRRNSPLHVLVGHELFHLIAPNYINLKSAAALNSIKEKLEKEVQNKKEIVHQIFSNAASPPDWIYKEIQKVVEINIEDVISKTHSIWRMALTELFCDLGCFHYFGPSVMFALSDLYQIHGGTSAKGRTVQHHPIFAQRLSVLFDQIENVEIYNKSLNSLIKKLKHRQLFSHAQAFDAEIDMIGDISRKENLSHPEITYATAYEIVLKDLKDIWNFLEKDNIDNSQCWFKNIDETVYHLDRVRNSIPSGSYLGENEISGRAGHYSAISLASWIHLLEKKASRSLQNNNDLYVSDYLDDCNILLKSYDDANSIQEFNTFKG